MKTLAIAYRNEYNEGKTELWTGSNFQSTTEINENWLWTKEEAEKEIIEAKIYIEAKGWIGTAVIEDYGNI